MDNGDSGPGAQWEALDVHVKMHNVMSTVFRWCQKKKRTGCGCLDTVVTG